MAHPSSQLLSFPFLQTLPTAFSIFLFTKMFTVSQILSGKWARISAESFISVLSWVVFLFLDFLDTVFCIFFRVLDEFMEGKASRCYCESKEEKDSNEEGEVSETLYGNERKNIFREMGFLRFPGKWENAKKGVSRVEAKMTRWSDCGCESCVSWLNNGDDQKLHVVVMEPPKGILRKFIFPVVNQG